MDKSQVSQTPIRLVLALGLCLYTNLAASRVAFTLYALHLDARPFAVGALVAVYYIFPLALSWPVGRLADRFGSRWLLMFASLCAAAAMAIPYFFRELPGVFLAAAVSGLAMSVYNVIIQNLAGVLSLPEERTRNFSSLALVGSGSNFIGPLMAGYAVEYAGPALACAWLTAPSLLAVALLLWRGAQLPGGSPSPAHRTAMLGTLRDRSLWRTLTVSALVQLGMDIFHFSMPIYGHSIGLSSSAIGIVLSAFSLASFLVRSAVPAMVKRAGELRLLRWAFYVCGLAYLLIPFSGHAVALAFVAFLFGLSIGCSTPLVMVLMFSRSAEGRSGEAMGLRLTMNNVVRVIGPGLFGSLGSALGLLPVFIACALLMAAGGWLSRPEQRS